MGRAKQGQGPGGWARKVLVTGKVLREVLLVVDMVKGSCFPSMMHLHGTLHGGGKEGATGAALLFLFVPPASPYSRPVGCHDSLWWLLRAALCPPNGDLILAYLRRRNRWAPGMVW